MLLPLIVVILILSFSVNTLLYLAHQTNSRRMALQPVRVRVATRPRR
jgi:hypothetical protein